MKRLLLTIVCCSPFLFYPSISLALGLTGPSTEEVVSYKKAVSYEKVVPRKQYGPISTVETLWRISTKLRPNRSVSVQQTLLAIYKTNPYAFAEGNINKIIPESVITVPTLEFIQAQTDKEASALIAKYSRKKQVLNNKKKAIPAAKAKQASLSEIKTELQTKQDKVLIGNNSADKKALELAQKKLQTLQNELDLSHEQLILATEENQVLKLKLKPLRDELTLVNEQLESVLATQEKQQKIIDEYRAQLDAVKALPFSGEGLLNEILRWITSSLSNLLVVIISPILLLMCCFVVLQRIQAKRTLAAQEQELAESTAMLMEESGQYDTLLSDDIYDELEPEVDFSSDDSLAQEINSDELEVQSSAIDLEQNIKQVESLDSINLEDSSDTVIEIADLQETADASDDPFGIAALAQQDDLDDPFGGLLSEEEDLISSVDLDDPFGIAALVDEEELISSVDLNDSEEISAAQQADLDLAAQWESQISEQSENLQTEVDLAETAQSDVPAVDLDIVESPQAEFDLAETAQPEVPAVDLDIVESSQAELDLAETAQSEVPVVELDIAELQQAEEFDVAETIKPEESTEPTASDLDLAEIDALAELDEMQTDNSFAESADSLAQKLSDVAFNGDVPLPKVKAEQADDFIDIETLLDNSAEDNKDEPYKEIDFDLDFNDFPDVVNAEQGVDIDDDENGIAAQLDLARAYLEIDDKAGAKEILLSIANTDNSAQRTEVDKLLTRLA